MKYLVFALLIFLPVWAANAQSKRAANKRSVEKAVSKRPAAVKREKFDPLRDAAADLAASVTSASASGKRIILDVGGEWCVWCRIMDSYFTSKPELLKLRDQNFVWLKINMSPENENRTFLSAYPKIGGYPHLFVLESDGNFLHSQDTESLESANSYDDLKMRSFLTTWIKPKNEVH